MTEEPRMIQMSIFCEDIHSDKFTFPELLKDVAAWASTIMDAAPEKYRDTVKVEFDTSYGCGFGDSDVPYVNIYYERAETSEEVLVREALNRKRQTYDLNQRRLAYFMLKAEFGGE